MQEDRVATETKENIAGREQSANTHPHRPGQSNFKSILPEDVDWKPLGGFPSSVRLAVVVGEPSAPGPYVIRVKVPPGVKLMPHPRIEYTQ